MLPEAELPVHALHSPHLHHPSLAHHFEDLGQQREAATLGMWVFLGTEVLFFGGLFTAYSIYRAWYPAAFALASHERALTAIDEGRERTGAHGNRACGRRGPYGYHACAHEHNDAKADT